MYSTASVRSYNTLLGSLPSEEYQRIAPLLRMVPMPLKQVLQKQDAPIENVYFPTGGACSLVKRLQDGQVAEVATVGAEGAVGIEVFFGQQRAECEVLVQVPSAGVEVMSGDAFNAEMERRGAFHNHLIRYNQALTNQIMQTTVCNGLHSVERRASRWLLMMHDRAGADEFEVTHEMLAMMLGVRRPTVTLVMASLQEAGVIRCRRGFLAIENRAALEAAACECYSTVKKSMARLLPEARLTRP